MTDSDFEYRLRREKENNYLVHKALQWIKISVVAVFSLVAVDGAVTFNTYDDTAENTEMNAIQSQEISRLQQQVSEIMAKKHDISYVDSKLKPGVCGCIKKDNAGAQEFINCPAKNFVCDEESRNICESIHRDYEC